MAAAAPNPVRDYMVNILRVPARAAEVLVEDGIDDFDDLINMSDEQIQDIIKTCRRRYEGQQQVDGAAQALADGAALALAAAAAGGRGGGRGGGGRGAGAAGRGAGPPPARVYISNKSGTRVRQMRFYRWHMHRIQRDFVVADATVARLEELWMWNEIDKDQTNADVKEPEPLMKVDDARKTLDELDHYLLMKRGVNGTPLAYLTREHVVPVVAEDEGFGQPSFTDELIRRARHGNYPAFDLDNKFLWSIIRQITQNGFAWNWVSDQARTRNGRQAYMQLKAHYLGPSFRGKIKTDADKILETAYYDGKARNFTLEAYCSKLKKAFTDLEECGEPLTEERKVRIFLKGISRNPDLTAARSQIMATEALQQDIETAMNFVKTFENQQESYRIATRNVSTMETGGRGRGRGGRGGRGGRSGRGGRGSSKRRGGAKTEYLSKEKWNALSDEEKAAVRAARDAAGIKKRKVAAVAADAAPAAPEAAAAPPAAAGVGDNMTRRA